MISLPLTEDDLVQLTGQDVHINWSDGQLLVQMAWSAHKLRRELSDLTEHAAEQEDALKRLYAERSMLIEQRDAAVREVAALKMMDGNDRLIEARREIEEITAKRDAWRYAAFGALAVTAPEDLSSVAARFHARLQEAHDERDNALASLADAQDAYQALAALVRTKERVTIVTNVANASGAAIEHIEDERDPGCECFELCEHAGFCPARCP